MKKFRPDLDLAAKNFVIELGELVRQEIYRFAVLQMAPVEVEKIKNIHIELENNLNNSRDFQSFFSTDHRDSMALEVLELIVMQCDYDVFRKEIHKKIINPYFSIRDPASLDDENEEEKEYRNNIYSQIQGVFLDVYQKYSPYQNAIKHLYPPQLFVVEVDYELAYDYLINKQYLPQRAKDEEIEFDNGEIATTTNNYSFCKIPFTTFRVYEPRKIMDINYDFNEFEIPETSIFKRLVSGDISNDLDEIPLEDIVIFDSYSDATYGQINNSVEFRVDLSSPLSAKELEKAVISFRNKICFAQYKNRIYKKLLAENLDELNEASKFQDLEHTPFDKLLEVNSSSFGQSQQLRKLKPLLYGLMIYKAYKLEPQYKNKTLEVIFNIFSDSISKLYGRGHSAENMKRSYIRIKKLLKAQLEELETVN